MHPERKTQQDNLRRLMRQGAKNKSPFFTLEASKKRTILTARLFRKAYDEEAIVALRSPFVPTEIFYAMDIIPLCIEAFSSMLAGSLLSAKTLNSADDAFYSRETCSFLRCAAGAAMEDYLPTPDFLTCASYYCDSGSKTFYNLSRRYKKEYLFLDMPYHYDDRQAVEYLARGLEGMVKGIEEITGLRMEPERLSETLRFSNQAREYFLKVHQLRRSVPAPMLGGEAIDYALLVANTWGTKEVVEVYKLLYEELKERVENSTGAAASEEHRLLWRHLRPYYNNFIMDYLENQCRAVVAFEEINYLLWEEMDPKEPYRSLARKMLSNPPIGPIEHWIGITLDTIDAYRVNGVIEFAQWGCRHLNSAAQILRGELQKRGISLLVLDGDCIDARDYSPSQVKTRVDAFLKTLKR